MRISVILAHPGKVSFNHAIAGEALKALEENGHEARYHDLYEEHFDPVLYAVEIEDNSPLPDIIEKHCLEISAADGIIVVHPNWWGQPPAVLKGWIDRVFRQGVAYRFTGGDGGEGVPQGLLKAESALVFNTSNTPEERETNVFGDPLERIWKDCIFGLCGVKTFYRKMFGVMAASTMEERIGWLKEVRTTVGRYYPHFK